MAKRLSVIIPGYNTPEAWWKRCVDSVRRSIGPDDEIIVVDDGSRDGAAFLDALAGVRVVHQSNQGPSVARNAGMVVSQGEWVAFVDSDDEIFPEMFDKMLAMVEKAQCDVAVCGVEVVWPDDGLMKTDVKPSRVLGCLTAVDIKELAQANLLHYVWNKVYRRSFLETRGIRFPHDAVMGEDLIFNYHCIEANAKWCLVDYVGYRYYRGRTTLLSKFKPLHVSGLRHTAAIWRKYKEAIPGARQILGSFEEPSEAQIMQAEWNNIWMPGTPYSLLGRLRWLREHAEVGGMSTFVKKMIYTWLRRHFYLRPVRRWHIRRMYPSAVPYFK